MQSLNGYRKILFGFLIVGVGIAMDRLVAGGLSNNLLELIKFVTMGFFLGNGVEHVSRAVIAVKGDQDGDGDADEKDEQLDTIAKNLTAITDGVSASNSSLATIQQAISYIIEKAGWAKKA